jgi:hypothetical protein
VKKTIPGPLDWKRMYNKASPKTPEEKRATALDCRARGYTCAQAALISKMTFDDVKRIWEES